MSASETTDAKIQELWQWISVSLFLLLSLDMLTSYYASSIVGIAFESNPFMRWLLTQPLSTVLIIHLGFATLAIGFFYGTIQMLERTPASIQPYYLKFIEAWLGALIAAGLFIFANNLSVIYLGNSLI